MSAVCDWKVRDMTDILIAFAIGEIIGTLILLAVACFITWRWWQNEC